MLLVGTLWSTVATVTVQSFPVSVALDSTRAYITNQRGYSVSVIDMVNQAWKCVLTTGTLMT